MVIVMGEERPARYDRCRKCSINSRYATLHVVEHDKWNVKCECVHPDACGARQRENGSIVERRGHGVTYYVPWTYEYYEDSRQRNTKYIEDKCAEPPHISFDKERGKWKLEFDGPDSGGYDVQGFEYFFDTKEDIYKMLETGEE